MRPINKTSDFREMASRRRCGLYAQNGGTGAEPAVDALGEPTTTLLLRAWARSGDVHVAKENLLQGIRANAEAENIPLTQVTH